VIAAARIEQDAGDEKPRQHEEHVHATPAEQRNARDPFIDARRRPVDREVVEQDQDDRDAAQTV
jgi:hypothetical protein